MFKSFLRYFLNYRNSINNVQEHKELTNFLVNNQTFQKASKTINNSIKSAINKINKEIDGVEENEEKKRISFDKTNKNKKL